MKILVVFIDMVRLDHLQIFNNEAHNTLLDNTFRQIGGTLFTKCYSPSPDTPRSLACFQTGLMPYFNGCDTRIKWPRYFVKEDVNTIFDHAAEKGFDVNLCVRQSYYDTGIFKFSKNENIHRYNKIDEFVEKGKFSSNSLSFIGTPDLHLAVDDFGATEKAISHGFKEVNRMFDKYINTSFVDSFDHVFIFSDHGLLLESEWIRQKSKIELLKDGRTKLLMLYHKKGDVGINKDNRLASIIDLYSTLEYLIGGEDLRQGYPFVCAPKREMLHIEDHTDFSVKPEVMIKQWRIITNNDDILTDVYHTIRFDNVKADITPFEEYLGKNSPYYLAYVKQIRIKELYDRLKQSSPTEYFIGDKRIGRRVSFIYKAFIRIKRIILSKII